MATQNFEPPPTWAPVILETVDPASGNKLGTFNPVWLKWFLDLAALLGAAGGGSGTLSGTLPATQVAFGNASNVITGSTQLTWDDPNTTLTVGKIGSDGFIQGQAENNTNGAYGAYVRVGSADGSGNGGPGQLKGGTAKTASNGNGGGVDVLAGDGVGTGSGGAANLWGGGGGATGVGGRVAVVGGIGNGGSAAGNAVLTGGEAFGGGTGGNVVIAGGIGTPNGLVMITGLPTVAPATSGALWRDAGAGNVVKCVP